MTALSSIAVWCRTSDSGDAIHHIALWKSRRFCIFELALPKQQAFGKQSGQHSAYYRQRRYVLRFRFFHSYAVQILNGKKSMYKAKLTVNLGNSECQRRNLKSHARAFTKSSLGVLDPDSYCAMRISALFCGNSTACPSHF